MLTIAVVILVWSLGTQIWGTSAFSYSPFHFGPGFRKEVSSFATSLAAGDFAAVEQSAVKMATFESWAARLQTYRKTLIWWRNFLTSCILMYMFAALAGIAYFLFPFIYNKRLGVTPLARQMAPGVVAELQRICSNLGLREEPELYLKSGALDGLATHRWGKPVLILAGLPGALDRLWDDLHRAVALHELGHVVNRDIPTREIARAVWIALGPTLVLAYLIFLVFRDPTLTQTAIFAGRTLGELVVVWGLWSGLVRTREFFADWRVVTWGLGKALARRLELSEIVQRPDRWSRWRSIWRMHPTNAERSTVLREPALLFAASPLLAGLTGALWGLVAGNAGTVIVDLMGAAALPLTIVVLVTGNKAILALSFILIFAAAPVVLLLFAHWMTDALGVQILRSAVFDLDRESLAVWGYRRLAGLALAFVAGLELGWTLTSNALVGWQAPWFMATWIAGMFLLIWIWLIQVRVLGRFCLGACTTYGSRVWMMRFLRWIATFQLAVALAPAPVWRLAAHLRSDQELLRLLYEAAAASPGSYDGFMFASFVLLVVSFLALAAVGILALAFVAFRLALKRIACPKCGAFSDDWRAVGLDCSHCGSHLAPWLYHPANGYSRIDVEKGRS